MKLRYACLAPLLLIAACSDNEGLTVPEFTGSQDAVKVANDHWGKLVANCPGLDRYHQDLTYTGLNDFTFLDAPLSRVEIEFKVSNDPQDIPNSLRAWGNT